MADTIIYVNLSTTGTESSDPWFNEFTTETAATLSSDLLDDANTGTGYSLDINTGFTGKAGGESTASAGSGGWPEATFEHFFFSSGSADLEVGGLTEGDTFSLELASHNLSSGRHTDWDVTPANEGTTRYSTSADAGAPTAPITFTGTVGVAGTINMTGTLVSSFWYVNGFKLTLTPGDSGIVVIVPTGPWR